MDILGPKESLIRPVGKVGGRENPVLTSKPNPFKRQDYVERGYERYIEEVRNLYKFLKKALDFFLNCVHDLPNSPITFIENLSDEDLEESLQNMRKTSEKVYDQHKDEIRKAFKQRQLHLKALAESCSSSSAKLLKLDPEAATGFDPEAATGFDPEAATGFDPEAATGFDPEAATGFDPEAATGFDPEAAFHDKMPLENLEFPDNIFMKNVLAVVGVLKTGFNSLKAKLGHMFTNAMEAIRDEPATDLKGFSLKYMKDLTIWYYYLRALEYLVAEMDIQLKGLRLDLDEFLGSSTKPPRCNPFKESRHHHNILITMELSCFVGEISALAKRQLEEWMKMREGLKKEVPMVSEDLEAKVVEWTKEILSESKFHDPLSKSRLQKPKQPLKLKHSSDSLKHLCDEDSSQNSPE